MEGRKIHMTRYNVTITREAEIWVWGTDADQIKEAYESLSDSDLNEIMEEPTVELYDTKQELNEHDDDIVRPDGRIVRAEDYEDEEGPLVPTNDIEEGVIGVTDHMIRLKLERAGQQTLFPRWRKKC